MQNKVLNVTDPSQTQQDQFLPQIKGVQAERTNLVMPANEQSQTIQNAISELLTSVVSEVEDDIVGMIQDIESDIVWVMNGALNIIEASFHDALETLLSELSQRLSVYQFDLVDVLPRHAQIGLVQQAGPVMDIKTVEKGIEVMRQRVRKDAFPHIEADIDWTMDLSRLELLVQEHVHDFIYGLIQPSVAKKICEAEEMNESKSSSALDS